MTPRLTPIASWLIWLTLAAVSGGLYALIARLSSRFEYTRPFADRPIPEVVGLLAAAFAVYLLAASIAARRAVSRGQLGWIAGAALAYRLILLPTTPIQEIDIYRYLWDGIVVNQGVNPFRFPPQVVREARFEDTADRQLARLVQVRDADPHIRALLERIHYAELPSVYPPVSQAVFAAAAWTTPPRASIPQRSLVLKLWLLAFDLATAGLVLLLLRDTGRPLGMFVLYAWCPLAIKEFSNSGHLDVIAVFLTTLATWLAVRLASPVGSFQATEAGQIPRPHRTLGRRRGLALASGSALALAVGAKLYPIWLFPLFAAFIWRGLGGKWFCVTGAVCLAGIVGVLWPLLPASIAREPTPLGAERLAENGTAAVAAADPSRGLRTFLTRWEMNDFLFMIVLENVKPTDLQRSEPAPWFSLVPQAPREALIGPLAERFAGDRWQASFFVVRLASLLAALAVAAWCIQRAWRTSDIAVWLESAFLTLAWFWFLSPTLNPWYWTWMLPLLAFARSRVWWWTSGVLLVYYLRFWFGYQDSAAPLAGTPYVGTAFFDYVVTWFEFGPWLACLILDHARRRPRS